VLRKTEGLVCCIYALRRRSSLVEGDAAH